MEKFRNRYEAGKVLATLLKKYAKNPNALILALPRGGVPVAYEIATALSLPLDVFIVRKLGAPTNEELAMGAIAAGGITIFNDEIIQQLHISKAQIDTVIHAESEELARRNKKYRDNRPFPTLKEKIIILVDDGIATGATMRAAIKALRAQKPDKIVMAVPVAEHSTCEQLTSLVDEVVCPLKPHQFYAVGVWYEYFDQTEDAEVYSLLSKSREEKN